jgi:hypothetical protein
MLAMVTGGTPKSTGVYYDDGWDRTLAAAGTSPSTSCTPGARVRWKQNLDIAYPVFSVFSDYASFWTGPMQPVSPLNPNLLPRDPANTCSKVYPHMFPRVNNIFELVHAAGGRTAWSDKHPAYEFLKGPSGNGIDDLYTPEIATNIGTAPSPLTSPLTAVITDNFQLTMNYDDLKVDAIVSEINGLDHTGMNTVGVPTLFGMNFQAVSVAQKLDMSSLPDGLSGGYEIDLTPTQPLINALDHTDASIGRMVAALDAQGVHDSTLIIISAKHGNSPIDRSTLVRIDPAWITNVIECNSTVRSSSCVPLVAQLSADTGPLIWLKDQTKTASAVASLDTYRRTLRISGDSGQGILSGDAITAMFANPLADARAPDIVLLPIPGTVYVAQSTTKDPVTLATIFLGWSKIADHGSFGDDDTHVGLLVSSSRFTREVVDTAVETRQIACTALEALALDCAALQSQAIEPSTSLPHDTTPPVVTVPAAITVEATGPAGAVATFAVSAADPDDAAGPVTCSPPSGSTFAIGTTPVNCSSSDTHGNQGSASFTVSVVDTTPPAVTVPGNVVAEATSAAGAVVNYSAATAVDVVDGPLPAVCSPASGSTFALGGTTVTCSATDAHGNTGAATFTVTVRDTTAPTLSLPAAVATDATGPAGAVVVYAATAVDTVDGAVPVFCAPTSGATFSIGTTIVTCAATDKSGNTRSGTFPVTVFGAADIITNLIAQATADNFQQGVNLLQNALVSLNAGDIMLTCSRLTAFMNKVTAQAGKDLSLSEAQSMVTHAANAKAVLLGS